jgi:hypothetical protein
MGASIPAAPIRQRNPALTKRILLKGLTMRIQIADIASASCHDLQSRRTKCED